MIDRANLADAEKAYGKALEFDPDNADALLRIGRIKQSINDPAAAERFFGRAAALPSPSADAAQELRDLRSNAGRVLASADRARDRGLWREAIDRYREFLRFRPEAANVWLHLGDCLRESGHAVEAETAYLRSRELDPKLAHALVGVQPPAGCRDDLTADGLPPPEDQGKREVPRPGDQPHALRMELGSRPQRPLPDIPGAVGERASGRFLSEIRSLPAGRYRARVQIMFSELAKGEPVVVNVQRLASSRVLDQVEVRADLRNCAVTDQIYLSFTLDKREDVEFYGWVGAHCETTLLRLLTILDDPTGSVVPTDFDIPTPTQTFDPRPQGGELRNNGHLQRILHPLPDQQEIISDASWPHELGAV